MVSGWARRGEEEGDALALVAVVDVAALARQLAERVGRLVFPGVAVEDLSGRTVSRLN